MAVSRVMRFVKGKGKGTARGIRVYEGQGGGVRSVALFLL